MKFEHVAESLRTGFYKVGHPSQFNDPFECRGNYINIDVTDADRLIEVLPKSFAQQKQVE